MLGLALFLFNLPTGRIISPKSRSDFIDSMQADIDSTSDFPSLSGGAPQPGNNAAAAAAWNNNSAVRQAVTQQPQQQPAVQRPQQQSQQPSQPQQQQQQPQPQQQPRAPSTAPSQHSIDQSYDGARSQDASVGRGTSDEFPPLGGQNGFANGQSEMMR